MAEQTKKTQAETQEAPKVVKSKKQLHEERMYKLWLEDSKTVRGIFRNHEVPGAAIEFPFRIYKQDKVQNYLLKDGQVYEVPRALAKHINNDCAYPEHKHAHDENGKPSVVVGRRVQRFSFMPLDFSDVGDNKPDIVTVTPL